MQVREKREKLKRHYHKENKKLSNDTDDNADSQWIWFNMIDEVFFGTAKVDGVSDGMDNGIPVCVDEQPPSQPEEDLQQVLVDELESPRTRAFNLTELKGNLWSEGSWPVIWRHLWTSFANLGVKVGDRHQTAQW